ncbi:MAG: DUF177 domain-containing protein [Actinomycetota bacterium]
MSDPLRPLRVNALELLRQPGSTRRVSAELAGGDLDAEHASLDGDVLIDVELESTNTGIDVRGVVEAPWRGQCRRCLTEVRGLAVADVDERYRPDTVDPGAGMPVDDEAYPIEQQQLDLAPMARQLVLLELDDERLCRADCAGLCPVCGIDRNDAACECDTTIKDDRWAALDGLVLDD